MRPPRRRWTALFSKTDRRTAVSACPTPNHRRPIRSFVQRAGRLTAGQAQALTTLWPTLGLTPIAGEPLDLNAAFGRDAPKILEIGFGNGESLAAMAEADPDTDFIGIEVHRPGVGHLLRRLDEAAISNVRLLCHDAVDVLRNDLRPASLNGAQIYFPDPWRKQRHHKRRLIQPEFVALLADRIAGGGFLHLATDWEDYARYMLAVLEADPLWRNQAGPGSFIQRPRGRPETKFERRGRRLGHGVWDLLYAREGD